MTQSRVTVRAPVDVVYAFWRSVHNYPEVLPGIERVEERAEGRSHWTRATPSGGEFDAELAQDEPNRLIAWHVIDGTAPFAECRVALSAHDGLTEVEFTTDATAGTTGQEADARVDLQRFKDLIEQAYAASGLAIESAAEESLGSSMGATTEDDLKRISAGSDPASSPSEVDDPATR